MVFFFFFVVTGASCLNGGHSYDFTSSMGHPKSNSVLLVYEGMRTHLGHQCCIIGSSR
jgi:hypothetical protein